MTDEENLSAIRVRVRHIDETLAELRREMRAAIAELRASNASLAEAEAQRRGREEEALRARANSTTDAHERGAYVRTVMGWVPWLLSLLSWGLSLWLAAQVRGNP